MIKRRTIQRSLILSAVTELGCHATAEEIYSFVSAKCPHVSRGTVYRNLTLLSETGEIRRVEMTGGADRFDHLCHDHYHLRCVKCGKVFDAKIDYFNDLEQRIKDTEGFTLLGHDIIFKGICLECNK